MKSETEIRKALKETRKSRQANMTFWKSFADERGRNYQMIPEWRNKDEWLKGHIACLKWILNEE